MELTILLARVFGVYFLMMGLIMLVRRQHFLSVLNSLPELPAVRFMMGIFLFIGGNFLIQTHHDWSTGPKIIVSLLGWVMIVKSLVLINLSESGIRKWVKMVSGGRYRISGVLALVVGIYLLNFGFALGLF
ncbi:MAG: hypothetical protein Q7R67_02685 [bacterium]|nr:hypothetical protein [bacterium]